MSWKLHLPLIRVAIAATLACGGIFVLHSFPEGLPAGAGAQRGAGAAPCPYVLCSAASILYFLAGAIYTHLFEYYYHKLAMHRTIRIGSRTFVDQRHRKHHQIFQAENFQSQKPEDLQEVTTSWYVFPALLALHYALFLLVFPARFAPAFFLGVTIQFLIYEATHWFTHVADNAFDRFLRRVPLLSGMRALQIRHHRIHHAIPVVNYNFTPPYLGDRCSRTYAIDEERKL